MGKVSLFFAGDIVIKRGQNLLIDNVLKADIAAADLALANFEGPETNFKKESLKAGPSLRQAVGSIKFLKSIGFGFLSLANNHIMDYGQKGLTDTINTCRRNRVMFAGVGLNAKEVLKPNRIKLKGQKISIISCAEKEFGFSQDNQPGYAPLFEKEIDEVVSRENLAGYFVIVIVHGGIEECPLPTAKTRSRYHELVHCGAKLVLGSHPHVPQGYERWEDGLIFYSLGDFSVGFSYSNSGDDRFRWGLTLKLIILDNKIKQFNLIPIFKDDGVLKYTDQRISKKINKFLIILSKILANSKEFSQLSEIQNQIMFSGRYLNFINQIFVPPALSVIAKKIKPFGIPKKYLTQDKLLLLNLMMVNESHSFIINEGLRDMVSRNESIVESKNKLLYSDLYNGVNYYNKII